MMPDFFDIVNLSIEAGMGLDAALLKVCKQTKGPLSEEFLQTLEDMKLGKSRREAFSDLRMRVPVHQFQSIITSLIQADMLGVGNGKGYPLVNGKNKGTKNAISKRASDESPS